MARPSKPLALVKGHRTKAEKEVRAKSEASLLTGTKLKESPEVKSNSTAHKEFVRIRKLLQAVDKDDDLYGNLINTHCLLHTECKEFETLKQSIREDLGKLNENYQNKEIDFMTSITHKDKLQNKLFTCDKKIMEKRKMILDISKENIMTIQSALRSIPKKPQKEIESPMTAFLKRKQENGK